MSWKKLLSFNPIEFVDQQLAVCKGELPKGLRGSLYRNTVSTQKRRNGYPGHLFDGDGVVLKIEFKDEKAIGTYKFVQNEGYINEQQRDEYIYAGLGRTYTGNFLTKIFNSFSFKNPANIVKFNQKIYIQFLIRQNYSQIIINFYKSEQQYKIYITLYQISF